MHHLVLASILLLTACASKPIIPGPSKYICTPSGFGQLGRCGIQIKE